MLSILEKLNVTPPNLLLNIVLLAVMYFAAFGIIDVIMQQLHPIIRIKSVIQNKIFTHPELVRYAAKQLYKADDAIETIKKFVYKHMLVICIGLSLIEYFKFYTIFFEAPEMVNNFVSFVKNNVTAWLIQFINLDREVVVTIIYKLILVAVVLLLIRFIYATLRVRKKAKFKLAASYLEKADEDKIKLLIELLSELVNELIVLSNKCAYNYLEVYKKIRPVQNKNKVANARRIFEMFNSLDDLEDLQMQATKVDRVLKAIEENKLISYYHSFYSDFSILYRVDILNTSDKLASTFNTLFDCNEISKLHIRYDETYLHFMDSSLPKHMETDFDREQAEKNFINDADLLSYLLKEYFWNTYDKVHNIKQFLKLDAQVKRTILHYSFSRKAISKSQTIFEKLIG